MEFTRLFDLPYYQLEKYPQRKSIGGKPRGKEFWYSTKELVELVNKVSLGLYQIGVRPGDKIATISYNNRPEWNVIDLGMQQIGAINVPVYPTISAREYVYIFNDAEVKYCFVGHGDLIDKVREAQTQIPSLREIFAFDSDVDAPNWETIFAEGDLSDVEAIKANIKPSDMATIIYTSGTTGDPKGVMLTHDNICSNIRDVMDLLPIKQGDTALSFLPLCHIFERMVVYTYIAMGVNIRYAESVDTLRDELPVVCPHVFSSVPRLLEKVYERVYSMAMQGSPIKKKIFLWAVGLTEKYEYGYKPSGFEAIQWKIADKLVFSKIRARLGGRVQGIVTGAAACPRKIAQFFSAAGIPIREGYGLTETSPVISFNRFDEGQAMLGCVGVPIGSVTVRIDEDDPNYGPGEGEILCKGPNVMTGYYNKQDKTDEVIDKDGWFHTGDVGKFVDDGKGNRFLKITDRKKELLKTSGGKYIAPSPIESRFKEEFMIEQMMVLGNNEKFCAALIVPSFDAVKNWCKENNVAYTTNEEMVKHPKVLEAFQELVDQVNPNFGKIEQIKKFVLMSQPWDVATDELTPTMKLKRRVIMDKFAKEIAEIYREA
jgi:long-chain acyl-CoA synthetase